MVNPYFSHHRGAYPVYWALTMCEIGASIFMGVAHAIVRVCSIISCITLLLEWPWLLDINTCPVFKVIYIHNLRLTLNHAMHDTSNITEELQMMDPPESKSSMSFWDTQNTNRKHRSGEIHQFHWYLVIQNIDYLSSRKMMKILILTTLLHKKLVLLTSCSSPTQVDQV